MRKPKMYAIYKGDEFITLGTAYQCAEYLGITVKHVQWMTSPTCKKRNKGGLRMDAILIEND